ncbi:MAG: cation:proton antiporter [Halomonas sp.]|nr:cation:proton antiporter [Halomonas sp.]
MDALNLGLAFVGGLIFVLGLLSSPVDRSWLSPPMLAFLLGVLIGPEGLVLLEPAKWGNPEHLLEQAARLTLGISLMGIALRLPARYPFKHWRSLAILLGVGMPAMWLIGSLLSLWCLGLPLIVALLVGACVSPTDPVIASSIVTGGVAKKHLPADFRHLLSSESGANDGLAYPLVFLPILLLTEATAAAWQEWLTKVWLWEIGGSVLVGAVLGWLGGQALRWAENRSYLAQPSFLAISLSLTLLVLGVGKLLGTDSILAVFVAGVAFDQVIGGKQRSEEDHVQDAINMFFTLPVFVLFGLIAPWQDWLALGWQGLALVVLVLLLRRLPVILLLRSQLPPVRKKPISRVMGWFGPIGVSALFYAALAARETGNHQIWVVASLVVLGSIIVHGITAAPFARLYYRRARQPIPGGDEG